MLNTSNKNSVEFSVVIPVYNAEKSLNKLCSGIIKAFTKELKVSFEIILVDDASSDNSWDIMEELHLNEHKVKIIQLLNNSGQHNAIMCGISFAKGDYIITMDDDLQHPPEEIPKLVNFIIRNPQYDAIIAINEERMHSIFRNVGSYFANKLINLAIKKPANIKLSSFRIINHQLKDAILSYRGRNATLGSFICILTKRIANIKVKHNKRVYGRSNYSIKKLIQLTLSNIFNFSVLPLKLISIIGFMSSLFALLIAAYITYQKIIGNIKLSGFTTITVLIALFSGIILFSIGILGNYIMIILKNINSDKQFMIRNKKIDN
ncbi:MAG: glycosyltransferase family 2 protein [Bacteroidales bacterium]|nr:glycosyltransferase family 2 protein [Bacteroidales bacterium]